MRIFAPSYQIPGGWAENCAWMAANPAYDTVAGVELLLFRYDDEDRELFSAEWPDIREYRGRFGFSIHLPDPLLPRHEALFELTADTIEGAVMHLPAGDAAAALKLREEFQRRYGVPILVENGVERPAGDIDSDLPLCLDCGHALLSGDDPTEILTRRGAIEAVHLHDCRNGRDHAPLHRESGWLTPFMEEIMRSTGERELRIVLELFDTRMFLESLTLLEALIPGGGR